MEPSPCQFWAQQHENALSIFRVLGTPSFSWSGKWFSKWFKFQWVTQIVPRHRNFFQKNLKYYWGVFWPTWSLLSHHYVLVWWQTFVKYVPILKHIVNMILICPKKASHWSKPNRNNYENFYLYFDTNQSN